MRTRYCGCSECQALDAWDELVEAVKLIALAAGTGLILWGLKGLCNDE